MKQGWTYKKLGEVCEVINGLWKGKKAPFINVGVIRNANFTKDFCLRYDNIEFLDVEERQYSKRKLLKGDFIQRTKIAPTQKSQFIINIE